MADGVIVTGNETISLPFIRARDGGINEFTFLHMGYKGMVDVRGTKAEPFMKPFVEADGEKACLSGFAWEKDSYWISGFTARAGDIEVSGTILATLSCHPKRQIKTLLTMMNANATIYVVRQYD